MSSEEFDSLTGKRREFTVSVCPECDGWGTPGWLCPTHHGIAQMEPVVLVRREERDVFRRNLGILAGLCSPETMERYRRLLRDSESSSA